MITGVVTNSKGRQESLKDTWKDGNPIQEQGLQKQQQQR